MILTVKGLIQTNIWTRNIFCFKRKYDFNACFIVIIKIHNVVTVINSNSCHKEKEKVELDQINWDIVKEKEKKKD